MNLLHKYPVWVKNILKNSCKKDEIIYCIPFNLYENRYCEGYTVVTRLNMYIFVKDMDMICYKLSDMSDFYVETMYGSAALFAKKHGISIQICNFETGKYIEEYTFISNACNMLIKCGKIPHSPVCDSDTVCPKCGRAYINSTKICPFCHSKKQIINDMWNLTKGIRLMMFFPLFAAIIATVCRFIIPVVQKMAINKYIYPPDGVQRGPVQKFIIIILAIVLIELFQRCINWLNGWISIKASNKFSMRLQAVLFEKIQSLSMSSLQKKSPGDIIGRINRDVNFVKNFITLQIPQYVSQIFSFILALILLLCISPKMCLFVFIPLPIATVLVNIYKRRLYRMYRHIWYLDTRSYNKLEDSFNGIRVVKTYGQEKRMEQEFGQCNNEYTSYTEYAHKFQDTAFPFVGFILRLGSYLITMFGYAWLFKGTLDLGTLTQFTAYAGIINEPLSLITIIPRNVAQFVSSMIKITELLEEEPDMINSDDCTDIDIVGNVELRDVCFGYESYKPVLKDISFTVNKGEMIGIVGLSGSGKSTLINLIMRLYDVDEGGIYIDGINIKDINQKSLRSQIGVVLQETHLFSGSIRDNICYAKPNATNEEVIRAAHIANAHDFIMKLPEGYNTTVGDRGYTLSGGERQRIAIARAVIHNPKILILDEATASLDTETENQIQNSINTLISGRTTFAIAHRLSTLRNADRLFVFNNGEIIEQGTHMELLKKRGMYYSLVMAQYRSIIEK